LSLATAKQFLREALTSKQLRVEIYELEGKGSGAANKWKLGKSASPGNLGAVEELLFASADLFEAPVIMALQVNMKDNIKTVGIAFADTSMQEMGVSEFIDNDLFSNTEVSSFAGVD
jgi:DNA mismatch repair protein MSH2